MAIYHCSTKPISRAKGRSATASSAYRSGSKITDRQTGEIHDYTKKQGVIHTEIIAPKSIDSESITREDLWNLAEQSERRKDARVAREFVVALPHEISRDKQIEVAKEFSKYLSDRYSVMADLAIHEPSKAGDDKNVHAHIMITTRTVKQDKKTGAIALTEKSTLELSNNKRKSLGLKVTQEDIKEIREKWANIANSALKKEGVKVRIDHRSYADQKKEQIPTKHEGSAITEARRRGEIIGIAKLNEEIKEENSFIKSRQIEEQKNHKPSLLERMGLKKLERVNEDLPPISEVIRGINQEIDKAKQLKLEASLEKIKIEDKMQEEKRKAKEKIKAKDEPLEREYKQIVYGDPDHNISSFKEAVEMNRFVLEMKASRNKHKLIEELKQKHKHHITKNTPISEQKDISAIDRTLKTQIDAREAEKSDKEHFVREETAVIPKIQKNAISQNKARDDDWDMDR